MKYYIALLLLIGLGCKDRHIGYLVDSSKITSSGRISMSVDHPFGIFAEGKKWVIPNGEYNMSDSMNGLAMNKVFSGQYDSIRMVNIKGDTFLLKRDTVYDMPLYVVNGRMIPRDSALKIPPAQITSIKTVLDEKDVQKYGEKAKKGVIYITTRGNYTIFNIKTANYQATKDSLPWSNDTTSCPIPSGTAYFSAKDVGHLIKIKKQLPAYYKSYGVDKAVTCPPDTTYIITIQGVKKKVVRRCVIFYSAVGILYPDGHVGGPPPELLFTTDTTDLKHKP